MGKNIGAEMTASGLVLKPLTPAEAAKSRSLSGLASSNSSGSSARLSQSAQFQASLSSPAQSRAVSSKVNVAKSPQKTGQQKPDQQKSHRISNSSKSVVPFTENIRQNSQSILANYLHDQSAYDTSQSPFDKSDRGQATPGSGMLSSGVLFVLQSDASQNTARSAVGITRPNVQGQSFVGEGGEAGKALSAYARAQESVQRIKSATISRKAIQQAKQEQQTAPISSDKTATPRKLSASGQQLIQPLGDQQAGLQSVQQEVADQNNASQIINPKAKKTQESPTDYITEIPEKLTSQFMIGTAKTVPV